MRRTTLLACSAAVSLMLAACGSDSTTSASEPTTADGSAAETTTAESAPSETTPDETTPGETTPAADAAPAATSADKPKVEIPGELPTELQATELRAGTGAESVELDTLVLHYVGVRSEDGTEFDNSWDSGQPFTVKLGTGQVISGWDQGLIGTQAGGQYQLDIPADLAYGDAGAGDIIKPGDALTFVVDVLAVLRPSTPDQQPEVDGAISTGATSVEITDLVEGDGAEVRAGDSLYLELIAFRGDTGEQVDSSWGAEGPWLLVLEAGQTLDGLVEGIPGMKVGGRRQIVIPAEAAFGATGSSDGMIPANVDLVVVIDAVYVASSTAA